MQALTYNLAEEYSARIFFDCNILRQIINIDDNAM